MMGKTIYNPKYRALVEFIRAVRKERGMTQSELGRRMRLSRRAVQKIEAYDVRLDLVRYVTLCRILGLDAGQLLGRLEEASDEEGPLSAAKSKIRGKLGYMGLKQIAFAIYSSTKHGRDCDVFVYFFFCFGFSSGL